MPQTGASSTLTTTPSITRRPSPISTPAFLATIHVLIVFFLAVTAGLVVMLVRHRRQQGQRAIPFLTRTHATTSSAPSFDHDSHFTLSPASPPVIRLNGHSLGPATSSPSSYAAPRTSPQPIHPAYRSHKLGSPMKIPAAKPKSVTVSHGLVANKPAPAARYTWSSDIANMPITSDTTEMSNDDVGTLGERGVVNQGFAEMLARREKGGRDIAALVGSEGGSTDAGGGDIADESRKSYAGTLGRIGESGEQEQDGRAIPIPLEHTRNESEGGRASNTRWQRIQGQGKQGASKWPHPGAVEESDDDEPETPSWMKPPPPLIVNL